MSRERQQGWALGITVGFLLLALIFGSIWLWTAAFGWAIVFAILVG